MFFHMKDEGLQIEKRMIRGYQVRTATVSSERVGKRLGRALGKYHTIEVGSALHELMEMRNLSECLADLLRAALDPLDGKRLLICGLGNASNPADSLGPEITGAMPLRFLSGYFNGRFAEVSAFTPGVSMVNNLSTDRLVKGAVDAAMADGVILIDSIVTHEYSHLYRVIEVSTAGGTTPHLGEMKVDWSILGVPVITIGVPTAIPANTFFPKEAPEGALFTDSRIADVITSARTIITYALIRVCWPEIPIDQCFAFAKISKDPTSLLCENFYNKGE